MWTRKTWLYMRPVSEDFRSRRFGSIMEGEVARQMGVSFGVAEARRIQGRVLRTGHLAG